MNYKEEYESKCLENIRLKEELTQTKARLQYYVTAINKIDDSIEYRCKDYATKERIIGIFADLTDKLTKLMKR
jgi:hypothetical protein